MATDDPRLNRLIVEGDQGEVVIVGCPFDFLRKRQINKGGEDNGACCLRRFYPKVGPLVNSEYSIDISQLRVSDFGNIRIQIGQEQEKQKFKNVQTKRFKGQFINYYKESPEKVIQKISDNLINLIKNNQLPFVFGGSKEGLLASVQAFHQTCTNPLKNVYILTGKPMLEKPYDGDKATSDNITTILNMKYPSTKFTQFGICQSQVPSEYIVDKQISKQKLPHFTFVTLSQIRKKKVQREEKRLGQRTQGLHYFRKIYDRKEPAQVNVSFEVLELFMGCRDISVEGLQFDEFLQIMLFLGEQQNLQSISLNQFNPSCEDYESSLLILNSFYYFLLGRARSKSKNRDE